MLQECTCENSRSVQGQPWIRAIRGSTGGPPLARFPAMHKGHILGSIKLVTVLGIRVLLFVILAATNMFGTRTAVLILPTVITYNNRSIILVFPITSYANGPGK